MEVWRSDCQHSELVSSLGIVEMAGSGSDRGCRRIADVMRCCRLGSAVRLAEEGRMLCDVAVSTPDSYHVNHAIDAGLV